MRREWRFVVRDQKACLLNGAYIKDGRSTQRRKSQATHDWLWALKVKLLKNDVEVAEIKRNFDKMKHVLVCSYTWMVPHKEYFTKSGKINERLGDTSNFCKVPDDLIFNTILGIDDSFIKSQRIRILPHRGTKHHIVVDIFIVDYEAIVNNGESFAESLELE